MKSREELDAVLVMLCEMIFEGRELDPDTFGRVGACVIDPRGTRIVGISTDPDQSVDKMIHAETVAISRYRNMFGDIPRGSIIVTTLSPCNTHMHDRYGVDCQEVIKRAGIKYIYSGYKDPTQDKETSDQTDNKDIIKLCKKIADTFLYDRH